MEAVNNMSLRKVLFLIDRKDIWLLLFFAFLGGHFMVANQEPESLWELLHIKAYYLAMAGSVVIAFVVSFVILVISTYLDFTIPWIDRFKYRFVWQVVSFVLTVAVAFLLAALYFKIRGYSIFDTTYFRQDFPIIIILICFIHLFYAARYAFKKMSTYVTPPLAEFEQLDERAINLGHDTGVRQDLNLDEKNTAYFFHKDRTNWAMSFDGEMEATDFLIDELMTALPESEFFKVQKGFIVNRNNIRSVNNASSRRMIIYLKTPYNKVLTYEEVGDDKVNCILIPQRQVKSFMDGGELKQSV